MKPGDHVKLYTLTFFSEGIVNQDGKTVTSEVIFNRNNQAEIQVVVVNDREYLVVSKFIK